MRNYKKIKRSKERSKYEIKRKKARKCIRVKRSQVRREKRGVTGNREE